MDWTPPSPPLQARAVRLRTFRPDDAPAVVEACRDPAIGRFTFMQEGLSLDDARAWIDDANERWNRGVPRFAITDAPSDRLLGQVGIAVNDQFRSAEAFYWVTPSERQRGVAATSLRLVCDWAFANGIERVYLLVHPENDASHGVATRCGFTREGTLRAFEPFKGGRPDLVSWSLLPTDARPG